ncbi:hypothetical protein HOLleu_30668 [Holothuria leucospilota]|uniref:Endonuclease/reverse transcript n=1 Tax=Holothuria leucospilota TaxID=206669 RepID=A0A9Q1H1C5_HOLLE|nr:hypothetical protein HOLleu_30668 [Holothuria leucospilota]
MRFQPSKCNIITFARKKKPVYFDYVLNGEKLLQVDSIKYLGVFITSDLSWDKHVQFICNKGNRTLGVLQRNLSFCPSDVKLTAYKGLLRPVLEYASSVWDPHQIYLQDKLDSIQRRSARFISSTFSREPGRKTRGMHNLHFCHLYTRSNCYKYSFLPNTVKDWNSPPASLVENSMHHN